MLHSVTVTRAVRHMSHLVGSRHRRILVAILLSLAALGLAVARADVHAPLAISATRLLASGPVYTVAEVERQMEQDPQRWAGRTVLVQGRAAIDHTWSAPDSFVTRLALIDPARSASAVPLTLQWGSADPLLAQLRRLPLVGRFAPQPQRPHWDTPAVYRVQLCCLPGGSSGSDDAVLLDADPGY